MSDYLLIDGDKAEFIASFGAATVVVRPGTLTASGPATVNGTKVCVAGDERTVSVPGCMYTTPSYPTPGTGTLQIKSLRDDQIARKTRSGAKAVLLVGRTFDARFVVQTPATMPRPPAPPDTDPSQQYAGTGTFTTTNTKLTGV